MTTKTNAKRILKLFQKLDAIRCELDDIMPEMIEAGQERFDDMSEKTQEGNKGVALQEAIDLFQGLLDEQITSLGSLANEGIELLEEFVTAE